MKWKWILTVTVATSLILSLACTVEDTLDPLYVFHKKKKDNPWIPPYPTASPLWVAAQASIGRTTGITLASLGNKVFALAGTSKGVWIAELERREGSALRFGPAKEIDGPIHSGEFRDVEVWGDVAYVASSVRGDREGIMVLQLNGGSNPVYLNRFTPKDGNPLAFNLSVDQRGYLLIARENGCEIWDLKQDPAHPKFLARIDLSGSVADLVVKEDRLYLAEGTSRCFSAYDLQNPATPKLIARWAAKGFAQCLWPADDDSYVATLEENPSAPIRIVRVHASGPVDQLAETALPNQATAFGLKVNNGKMYVAAGASGVHVFSVYVSGSYSQLYRIYEETRTVKNAWDLVPIQPVAGSTPYAECLATDLDRGVFWLRQ